MTKKLKIRLRPNGEIEMETVGVKGKECLDYIKLLQKLTEVKISKTELKDEKYETETQIINCENAEIRLD